MDASTRRVVADEQWRVVAVCCVAALSARAVRVACGVRGLLSRGRRCVVCGAGAGAGGWRRARRRRQLDKLTTALEDALKTGGDAEAKMARSRLKVDEALQEMIAKYDSDMLGVKVCFYLWL